MREIARNEFEGRFQRSSSRYLRHLSSTRFTLWMVRRKKSRNYFGPCFAEELDME